MPAYRHRTADWRFLVLYLGVIAVVAGVAYIVLDAVDQTILELPLASLLLGGSAGGALVGMAYIETLENWYESYGIGIAIFLALLLVWLTTKAFFAGFAIGLVVGLVVTLVVGEVLRAIRSATDAQSSR